MPTTRTPASKSPLHNFPPRLVKWTTSSKSSVNNNHHHICRTVPQPEIVEDHHHNNHIRGSASRSLDGVDLESRVCAATPTLNHQHVVGSPVSRNKNHTDKSPPRRILLPIQEKEADPGRKATESSDGPPAKDNKVDPLQKQWNLRPRRAGAATRSLVEIGGGGGGLWNGEVGNNYNNLPTRLGSEESMGKKMKLWISLSKEEIEEDIYSLTGSKPSRKPRRRPRNVQKRLDKLYPGMWLVGVSSENYQRRFDAALSKK